MTRRLLLARGLPVPGQQGVKLLRRMIGDPRQHVGEPCLGIDVAEFGRLDEREHDRCAMAAKVRGQVIMPDVWRSRCWLPIRFIPVPAKRCLRLAILSTPVFGT